MATAITAVPKTLRRPNTLLFETKPEIKDLELITLIVACCPDVKLQGFYKIDSFNTKNTTDQTTTDVNNEYVVTTITKQDCVKLLATFQKENHKKNLKVSHIEKDLSSYVELREIPFEVLNSAIISKLSPYVTISEPERLKHRLPNGQISLLENGVRKAKVLKIHRPIPPYINIYGKSHKLFYIAPEEEKFCWNCWGKGHNTKSCVNARKCRHCYETGHDPGKCLSNPANIAKQAKQNHFELRRHHSTEIVNKLMQNTPVQTRHISNPDIEELEKEIDNHYEALQTHENTVPVWPSLTPVKTPEQKPSQKPSQKTPITNMGPQNLIPLRKTPNKKPENQVPKKHEHLPKQAEPAKLVGDLPDSSLTQNNSDNLNNKTESPVERKSRSVEKPTINQETSLSKKLSGLVSKSIERARSTSLKRTAPENFSGSSPENKANKS